MLHYKIVCEKCHKSLKNIKCILYCIYTILSEELCKICTVHFNYSVSTGWLHCNSSIPLVMQMINVKKKRCNCVL